MCSKGTSTVFFVTSDRCFAALSMTGLWFVTLSEAKGLPRWAEGCFAALSMTVLPLVWPGRQDSVSIESELDKSDEG